MTLRERIEAELDRKQAIAEAAIWSYERRSLTTTTSDLAKFWDMVSPAAVLAGLAEDRDILKRHRQSADVVMTPLGLHTVCVYCSDLDSDPVRVVGWPCWDAISVARRHGITP